MQSLPLSPVVVFAYNRPDHLTKTLRYLESNEYAVDTDVIVFSDGPKNPIDQVLVDKVREVLKQTFNFKSLKLISRPHNFGLANSVIDGVSKVCNEYGKIIVLEDDMITSKFFLRYMNEALFKFQNNEEVISIHGYVYPFKSSLKKPFFLKGADCWGWATWDRGWSYFNPSSEILYSNLSEQKLLKRFDFFAPRSYSKMLKDHINGKNNSWAIRWYASALIANKLTLYPHISLVKNIGLDNSGTHCGSDVYLDVELSQSPIDIPENLEFAENEEGLKEFIKFFKYSNSKFYRYLCKLGLA